MVWYGKDLLVGDIILIHNKRSFLHKLICCITSKNVKDKVAHAQLYIGNEQVIEAKSTGVKVNNLRTFNKLKHSIYIKRYEYLDFSLRKKISNMAMELKGQRYSFLQLLAFLIKYIFKIKNMPDVDKKAVVCSELIVEIFRKCGIRLFPSKDDADVSPQDLMYHPYFKTVFEYKKC